MSNIAQQLSGNWKTQITVQNIALHLTLSFQLNGELVEGTFALPDQGMSDLLIADISLEPIISFDLAQIGFKFEGHLVNNSLVGKFSQGAETMNVSFEKYTATLPGNPALVSPKSDIEALINLDQGTHKYQVADYFKKPQSSSFQLSPDGTYLSYLEKDEQQKRHVYVKDIKTGNVVRVIEEKDELIKGYAWISEERLIYVMDEGGNENYHVFAINIDGSNQIDLTPYKNVKASILNSLKEQKDYIILSMNLDNPQVFEPYKVNVHTGAADKLFTNEDVQNPIVGYDFNKDGVLRAYTKMKNGIQSELYFKKVGATEFEKTHTFNWDDSFNILSFNYASENPNEAYVLTNLDSDIARIVLYDFTENKVVSEVYSNDKYDATIIGISRKRNWEIDYLGYEGEKVHLIPVSTTFKQIINAFETALPGYEYSIAGKTDNEDQYLVFVQSDCLYGKYYHYDFKNDKITLLYDLMPQLEEADMSPMLPIQFTSRDGKLIHGYITLPKSARGPVPMIVNPHGGPQGVRDSWGFNPEAQLFASRGYATLQVNFRISGGYGKQFLRDGFKQVGRKVMEDVEDGVKYAIEQGWAMADKIAIYGGSHGGYATLMGLVKTPELYQCGVDYVGVSNIFTFFDSIPEYWKPFKEMLKEIWYDLDNPSEATIAKEVSPVYQLDKIQRPLFVVQGANDPRVNINESDQIVQALRDKGFEVPYLVKYNEGHGFHKEENRIQFYQAMMGFFSKYLH